MHVVLAKNNIGGWLRWSSIHVEDICYIVRPFVLGILRR
jgi:hypothetical protein